MLDGQQIRVPDVLRFIALKLHATRDTARRTTEIDWQDMAGLVLATNRTLEDPELRAIIAGMKRFPSDDAILKNFRRFNQAEIDR